MNPSASPTKFSFCTIVSKNYLARARALAESLAKFNPDCSLDVLLVDRIEGCFDPAKENFHVTLLEELPIPDLPRFCFQYDILELNTAAKPTYLKHLFARGADKLVYLDPDTLLFDSLSRLSELLETNSIILTPHTTKPYPAKQEQREVDLLRAGVFNLGFIAVRDTPGTIAMLDWWAQRLYTGCRSDMVNGYHVDQKWMDLVPALFEGVFILKEPGYNCATWNFHDHQFSFEAGRCFVGGVPLKFFHFSAFNPFNLTVVSRNQNAYNMENIGELKNLFTGYSENLMRHGFARTVRWPYAFGHFDNGETIPPRLRRVYLQLVEKGYEFGNPFETKAAGSIYEWWQSGGENMKREELIDLLERDTKDWKPEEIENSLENLSLYEWFRRANPKPQWDRKPLDYAKRLVKYYGLQLFMQWLPPLFAKQYVLNQFFMAEIQHLKNASRPA